MGKDWNQEVQWRKVPTITGFDKNTVKVEKEHEQDAATKPQYQTGRK